jgi:transposase
VLAFTSMARAGKGGGDGGMGRSRGGLTTKIHALVDAEGRPIRIAPTPGQAHDGTAAEELLTNLKPGATLLADKAYDSNAIRDQAQEQDVWANIPPKSNRKGSFVFSAFLYRYRNLVERFFNKLKQFRAIATRYDKDPANFLAAVKIVSTRIWIRSYESAA